MFWVCQNRMPTIALQGVNNENCLFSFLDKLSFIFRKQQTENALEFHLHIFHSSLGSN